MTICYHSLSVLDIEVLRELHIGINIPENTCRHPSLNCVKWLWMRQAQGSPCLCFQMLIIGWCRSHIRENCGPLQQQPGLPGMAGASV